MSPTDLPSNASQAPLANTPAAFSQESIQTLSMSDGQAVSPNRDMGWDPAVSPWHTLSPQSQHFSPQRSSAAMSLMPQVEAGIHAQPGVQTYPTGTDPALVAQFERVASLPPWDRAVALVQREWRLPIVTEFTGVPWTSLLSVAMDGPLGAAVRAGQRTPKEISDKFGVPMPRLVQECQMRGLTLGAQNAAARNTQTESMDIG